MSEPIYAEDRVARSPASAPAPDLSVVIPIYDEAETIPELCRRLSAALEALALSYEVIAVNDGSLDTSLAILVAETKTWPQLKVINFRRNYGQTAALMAGMDFARGERIVTIDADLQNDPQDIGALLEKLDEGFDVVSGWRRDRRDANIRRVLVSKIANRLISRLSGVQLHDYGCTLKAYRRDIIKNVRLYGEMHRFIPIFAKWQGARVTELEVRHYPRLLGKSKYGLGRVYKVTLDIAVVKFFERHFAKPIYVFGGFGLLSLAASVLVFILMVYLKLSRGISLIMTPLPLMVVTTFMLGAMSFLMGLLAEVLVRIYYESQRLPAYQVRDLINFE
ncbi:MAG TPA: glycosyltransferase family 2 protein [Stellaceae bacterium]|nr:glycosyltransferase family 2 protein [Stellaceae bacterium]